MTVMPDPPPQVEVRRTGSSATTGSMAFQLFAAQTLPAGSTATSVIIWMLPLWNTWMASPVFVPAGCPFVFVPGHQDDASDPRSCRPRRHHCRQCDTPHGTLITLLPVKPVGAGWVPSGRIMFITPVVILGLLRDLVHCSARS